MVLVTEHEFYDGILNAENVNDNALCFVREIEDINDRFKENDALISKYIDLNEDKTIDQESMALLNDLKNNKLKKALSDNNLIKLKVCFNLKINSQLYNFLIFLNR